MPTPQNNPTIRCCSQHLMVGFFFDLFSYSGLRAFFTSDLRIVLQIMPPPKLPQPSGAVHSIWWLGFFFDLFSYSGLRAFFTSDPKEDYELYYRLCPTPLKITQPSGAVHSIWWLGFFLTSSPILGLRAFFTSDFTNCTTDYAPPQIKPNHQVLFTASDGSELLLKGPSLTTLLLFWT